MFFVRWVVAVLGALTPIPAVAVYHAPPTVYVYVHGVPANWQVAKAMQWVDGYTWTRMALGKCQTGHKCIEIQYKTINSSWAGVTQGVPTCKTCTLLISLNPQRSGYTTDAKRAVVEHELGHANGINGHNSTKCDNRMWWQVFCPNGKLPPRRFRPADQAILARN